MDLELAKEGGVVNLYSQYFGWKVMVFYSPTNGSDE